MATATTEQMEDSVARCEMAEATLLNWQGLDFGCSQGLFPWFFSLFVESNNDRTEMQSKNPKGGCHER